MGERVDTVNTNALWATVRWVTASAYHHGNLREALIDAAVEAVRAEGPDGLALRALARRVGVSHNAAYRHFAHRDELVAEVGRRAMDGLVESMQQRLATVEVQEPVLRARRRLAETGRGYVAFAVAEPGLFRLAASSLPTIYGSPRPLTRDPLALLGDVLDDLVGVGFLSAEARVGAEITCWSSVHGFSSLAIDDALGGASGLERDAVLDGILIAIDRSYAATTGTPVAPEDLVVGR